MAHGAGRAGASVRTKREEAQRSTIRPLVEIETIPKVCTSGQAEGEITAEAETRTASDETGATEAANEADHGNTEDTRPGLGMALRGMGGIMGLEPYPFMKLVQHCHQLTAILGGYRIHELVQLTFPGVSPDLLRAIICAVLYCRDPVQDDEEIRATVGLGTEGPETFSSVARELDAVLEMVSNRNPPAGMSIRVEKVKKD